MDTIIINDKVVFKGRHMSLFLQIGEKFEIKQSELDCEPATIERIVETREGREFYAC
jgi:hypothetical protein